MGWINNAWEFCLPLVSEKNEKGEYKRASLGRVSFWVTFGVAVYIWTQTGVDITASHMQMLYITSTYNLLKKASWFGNIKTGDTQMQISHEVEKDPYGDERPPRI